MQTTRRRYARYISISFMLILILLPFGMMQASAVRADIRALDSTVIIPPGSPIQIAIANSNVVAEAADLPLAFQMAVSEYGAIKGFTIQGNSFDTGCNAGTAATVAASIVANTQHVGVIGPLCSSSTTGAAPVFETAGLVMISGSNTGIGIHVHGPNIFNRVVIEDPFFDDWDDLVRGIGTVSAWETDFNTNFGHAPWNFAKYVYDATTLLLTRIEQISSVDGSGNLVIDRQDLATAVRSTTEYIGITGRISLDTNGTRINTFNTAVWTDQFSVTTLGNRWSWLDEDPSHWSLTANPGSLRIITQSPTRNRLIQPAPEGDFDIRTRVIFTPTENYQFAGLSIYMDSDNFMNFGRAYCNTPPPNCLENAIYFDLIEGGTFTGSNYATSTSALGEAYLRLRREGTSYTGFVSTNGTSWEEIGTHSTSLTPMYVGLYASGQTSTTELPADFDYFVFEAELTRLYLPLTQK